MVSLFCPISDMFKAWRIFMNIYVRTDFTSLSMNLAGDMNSMGGWFRYFFQPQGMAADKKRNTSGHVYWGWEFFICILCSDENNISIMNILFPALPFTRSINQPTTHPMSTGIAPWPKYLPPLDWAFFAKVSTRAKRPNAFPNPPLASSSWTSYEARFSRLV